MSEAMTNSEIEDVLSSIRRLVAQEARPEPRKEASPPPERLVLTAELRVGQANLTAPPTTKPLSQPDAQGEAASGDTNQSVSAQPVSALSRVADLIASPASTPAPGAALAQTSPEPDAITHADLEAAITELESVLGAAPQVARPDPEAAVDAQIVTDSEPEQAEVDAEQTDGPATEARTDSSDLALIDEDDLQILVARLVRAELRGQLGERITQQVRKLVRAEIARALDERNLLT